MSPRPGAPRTVGYRVFVAGSSSSRRGTDIEITVPGRRREAGIGESVLRLLDEKTPSSETPTAGRETRGSSGRNTLD